MVKHKQIIEDLTSTYENDKNNLAFLVTGSVAREEHSENSDLDLLLVSKKRQPFKEELIGNIVIEVKINTPDGFIHKMKDDPMNVYQWLDAEVIFDKNDSAKKVISEAKNIYENYRSDPKEISGVKRWLESTRIKIESARANNDELALGFSVSNILWQIVRGLYLLNNNPVPPNTTAFRRIKDLDNLPDDFGDLWSDILIGNFKNRVKSSLQASDFLIKRLKI